MDTHQNSDMGKQDAETMDQAHLLITQMHNDIGDAQDHLHQAKINNTFQADKHWASEDIFTIGDQVMLSTGNQHHKYTHKGVQHVAKFMPHFDGPYHVLHTHPEVSLYTLDLPHCPDAYPSFHASQ